MNNAERNRQANKNHYICSVVDCTNEMLGVTITDKTVFSRYFDGTQAQAIKHFKSLDKIRAYMKQDCYSIHIRANSLTIGWDC